MRRDIAPAEIRPVQGSQSPERARTHIRAHEDTPTDEITAHGADETQHHHVGEEMLVLDVAEDVGDALDGARVTRDVHEVAGH